MNQLAAGLQTSFDRGAREAALGDADQPRRRLTARHSVWIAVALLAYAFLHDNASMLPSTAGYGWARLVNVPRQVRIAEVLALAGLLAWLAPKRLSAITIRLGAGSILFLWLAACSYANGPTVGPADAARLAYMYLLPLIVFMIARELPWRDSSVQAVVRFLLCWIVVSAAVSWIQYLYFGYPAGDDITGFNQDAHANVSLLIIGGLLLLADGVFRRRRLSLVAAVVLGATAVLPSDLKALFLSPVLVVMLLWYYAGASLRRRAGVVITRVVVATPLIAVVVSVLLVAFSRIDYRSSERVPDLLKRVSSQPLSFGPVVAHINAVGLLLQSPRTFLLGAGPFRYANPISMGQFRENGALGQLTRSELLPNTGESGEDARVTLTTSLAVEFGVPAFVLLACLYGGVLVAAHAAARSRHQTARRYAAVAVPSVLLLLAAGAFGLFGSLSAMSLSWPVMILAGAASKLDAESRAIQKHQQRDLWRAVPDARGD